MEMYVKVVQTEGKKQRAASGVHERGKEKGCKKEVKFSWGAREYWGKGN